MSPPGLDALCIRRGIAADAPALAAFAARTFAETFAADNRPEDLQVHLASSYGVAQQTKELTDPDVHHRAMKFYNRAGFADVGSTDFHVGPDRQTGRGLVAVVPNGAYPADVQGPGAR